MESSSIKHLSTRDRLAVLFALLVAAYFGYAVSVAPSAEETLALATTNPPFGLAGVDLVRLADSVNRLEQSIPPLAAVYDDPADAKIIRGSIHPVAFLKTLLALEESRREFVSDPSQMRRAAYWRNLKVTAGTYEKDIAAWRGALYAFLQNRAGSEVYYFVESATSLDFLVRASDELLANARSLNKAIRSGNTEYHEPFTSPLWTQSLSEPSVTENDKGNLGFVLRFVEAEGWEIVSPAIEVPTDCFGKEGEPDFFYIVKLRNETVPMYYRQLFFRYTKARFADARYYDPLREKGFDYNWQPDFNLYACPDLSYQAEAMTVYKIRELLLRRSEREGGAIPEIAAVKESIRKFLARDPLRRSTQLELFRVVSELVAQYPGGALAEVVGEENARLLKEVLLIALQKTGFLEEVVARGARLTENLPKLMRLLPRPLPAKELLLMRSYPSLYFMPFHRSIWSSGEPPRFIESAGRSRYYFSRDELKESMPDEKLIELMSIAAHLILRSPDLN